MSWQKRAKMFRDQQWTDSWPEFSLYKPWNERLSSVPLLVLTVSRPNIESLCPCIDLSSPMSGWAGSKPNEPNELHLMSKGSKELPWFWKDKRKTYLQWKKKKKQHSTMQHKTSELKWLKKVLLTKWFMNGLFTLYIVHEHKKFIVQTKLELWVKYQHK